MVHLLRYALPVLGLLLILSQPVGAAVSADQPFPAARNVPLGSPATLSVRWTVLRDNDPAAGSGATVSSRQGVFVDPATGAVYGSVARPLSQTIAVPPRNPDQTVPPPTVFTFTETVMVPADVVYRAYKSGTLALLYQREFTDCPAPGCTTALPAVRLAIAGSSGADFAVGRLALRFDDQSVERLLAQGAPLHAHAEVTFTGSGLLQAVWEVADPASTQGTPIFRPLRLVRQQLVAGQQATLISPPLPSDVVGLYLVRLRVTAPALDAELPVLRYFVTSEAVAGARPPSPVELLGPHPGEVLEPRTRFAWQPASGARVYQLEFYAIPRDALLDRLPDLGGAAPPPPALPARPTAGLVVPAGETATNLSQLTRGRLQSGGRYWWRVLALGEGGALLGVSPVRELRVP